MKVLIKFTLLMIISISLSCSLKESYPKGDMTLIFYLADDWDPKPLFLGPASKYESDVYELTRQQVDISSKRVVILFDGHKDGDSELLVLDSPFEKTYRKVNFSQTDIKTVSHNELNMGDPETLISLINYAKNKIPSENYTLYFGAHGTGYSSGYNSSLQVESDYFTEDTLEISEIAYSLEKAGGVNLMVYDACNIGNLENIYELKNSTDYLIASPELIPGDGNNYEYLIESFYSLDNATPYNLGLATLNSYYQHYNSEATQENSPWFMDKEILVMYDVKGINNVINGETFETDLINNVTNSSSSTYVYQRYDPRLYHPINPDYTGYFKGYYMDLNIPSVDEYIFTADYNSQKLISIYRPTGTYNSNYSTSAFSLDFPGWTTYLKSR